MNYETNVHASLARLVALGLTPDEVAARFHYLDVQQGGGPPNEMHADATLAVVDSMTSVLDAFGYEPNDTTGIESVYRRVVDPLRKRGWPIS